MAFVPPPRKKTILDNSKLKFSAAKLPDGTGRPQAAIFLNGANLRISVYTNVNNQIFDARMDLLTAQTFFDLIDHVADESVENGVSYVIENKHNYDHTGNKLDKPETVSKTVVGKDKEGRVYFTVLSLNPNYQKFKIQFFIESNYYHNAIYANGQPLDDGKRSRMAAKAIYKLWSAWLPQITQEQYTPPEPRAPGGGGNGGGNYNRGGGNNNGGGKSYSQNRNGGNKTYGGGAPDAEPEMQSFDGDLPF